jgi:hypothetical protein
MTPAIAAGERVTEPDKNPFDKLSDWLTGWKASFEQLRQRFGTLVAITLVFLVALSLVWWNWEELKKRPGVEWIVAHIERNLQISAAPTSTETVITKTVEITSGNKPSGSGKDFSQPYQICSGSLPSRA